jgi:hypothetical protein
MAEHIPFISWREGDKTSIQNHDGETFWKPEGRKTKNLLDKIIGMS